MKTYHLTPLPKRRTIRAERLSPFNYIVCTPADRFDKLTVGTRFLLSPRTPDVVCILVERTPVGYVYNTGKGFPNQTLLPRTVVYVEVDHDQLDLFQSLTLNGREVSK